MSERLYKRGDVWHCWYYDATGRQVRKSTRCRDKRAAGAVLRRYEQQASGAIDPAEDSGATVHDAIEELLNEPNVVKGTQHMREVKGGHLVRVLGAIKLTVLTRDDVRDYCRQRTEEGAAALTVKKELSTLSIALGVAGEKGWTRRDPSELIPKWRAKYVPRETWLAREKVELLTAELLEHRALWTWVACLMGGRKSEVEGLLWTDLRDGWIHVRGTKTDGARRRVPLAPELAARLDAIPKGLREGRIVGAWENAHRDLSWAAQAANRKLASAAKEEGRELDPADKLPERVTPNDLRRTFMSWLRQAGVDASTVAKLAGTSPEMVDRVYGRLSDDAFEAAIAKLPKAKIRTVRRRGESL